MRITAAPAIPDYELIEQIGSGAYGEVWLAINSATGISRAIKIVYRSTFNDERPFNREFEGIRKFDAVSRTHPSQLALFHVGRNDLEGCFYYVMELGDPIEANAHYKPRTLRSDLEKGRLPAERVLEIAIALAEALAHLHSSGLVHRDVKPSNIIFVNGRPKLADIGLVTGLSDNRSIVGTEGYLPPEGPGTPAADLYALGKVLYEALTALDRRKFPELPANLREWPDRILALELNVVLVKACAASVRDRYARAETMLSELRFLAAGKSLKNKRFARQILSASWRVVVAGTVLGAAILAARNELERRAELARQNIPLWEQRGTTNQAAWQALTRALQMGNTYTATGMSNSILELEQAARLDPNFASAWSALSVSLSIAVDEGLIPGTNALLRAKECAERAIQLAPGLGPAYGSLANAVVSLTYDLKQAEPLFRKGISLATASWPTRNNLAWFLLYHGRLAEAEEIWKSVIIEHPQVGNAYVGLAFLEFERGRFTDGMALFEEGLSLMPDRPLWHSLRGDLFWAAGDQRPAATDWLRQIELDGIPCLDRLTDSAALRKILEEQGAKAFLEAFISLLEQRKKAGHFVSSFDLARLHGHACNPGPTLDYLSQAIEEKRAMVLSINVNPAFRCVRQDRRYQAILERLHLLPKHQGRRI